MSNLFLRVESPLVRPGLENFRPISMPPAPDFPIVIDADGKVTSRYADCIWDLTPWEGKSLLLNFGDGPGIRKSTPKIDSGNADLLRKITFWWMYGERGLKAPRSYLTRFTILRTIFVHCSKQGILASNLMRYPRVSDSLSTVLMPSGAAKALTLLHHLYDARDQLGFTLLDREGLRRLESCLPRYEGQQTLYIPPRIWGYQVSRLRAFLDDFHNHREQLEACFHYCLDAYAQSYGSLSESLDPNRTNARNPFGVKARSGGNSNYRGPFIETAERYGIGKLLKRWCLDQKTPDSKLDIILFGKYLTAVSEVGIRYLLNFSLMRIEEAWSLRTSCWSVEQDERFGPIYLLRGRTKKTVKDDDALWITSPSARVAVDAMSWVARLRIISAKANIAARLSDEDAQDPPLVTRAYEPWSTTVKTRKCVDRPNGINNTRYMRVVDVVPNLFDIQELRVTETDLQFARLMTPTIDNEEIKVGTVWPFSHHQLRRTGAVNMQASGLVSDSSLQYQLKHAARACSLYYGQGYSRLSLNQAAQDEYVRTMYEVMGKEISQLFTSRFVSPLGPNHKDNILKLVSLKDAKTLEADAKAGRNPFRETLLGGCFKRGFCSFGGIDNIVKCAGGDSSGPCPDALFDREKVPKLKELKSVIQSQLKSTQVSSPLYESLQAQLRSTENALNVLEE